MPTIFAPITATLNGAFTASIFVIRISGEQTINCLRILGVKKMPQHQKAFLHKIIDPKSKKIIDEALITFFAGPKSFTGEDVAEISIHGSPFILKKLSKILSEQKNVRFAEAGEFSKRAFLNGKLDLVQAEAIPDLIAAETASQHHQALLQLEGKLGEVYETWRKKIIETSAFLEAVIDFPDEDLPQDLAANVVQNLTELSNEIKNHLNDQRIGQKIKEGLSLVIIGAPNVGKSSLINFLANSEVAIVSEFAGTTRDIIEVHLSISGVAVKIADTAGIHETSNLIEKEGIRRALKKACEADLKIFMIDSAKPVVTEELKELIDDRTIVLINKIDLVENLNQSFFNEFDLQREVLKVSINNKINTSQLFSKLEKSFTIGR